MGRQQSGFTLIELVAVIVLLGILAVTALPKFVGLQADAREATLEGLRAAMQGAATQVYAASLIAGNEIGANTTTVGVTTIETEDGYPVAVEADITGAPRGILGAIDYDATVFSNNEANGSASVRLGYNVDDNGCYIEYNDSAGNGVQPEITLENDGC